METTLIEEFIERKLKAYQEPGRKGLPKGRTIGFSRQKYRAALSMLSADKKITVAMELGVSYGLLRKWNTEGPFRSLVRKHCREFAGAFVERLSRAGGSDRFRDIGGYSHELLAEILKAVIHSAERAEREGEFPAAFALLSSFLRLSAPALGEKAVKTIAEDSGVDLAVLERELKLGAIERVKRVLLNSEAQERERAEALRLLSGLETII